MSRARGSLRPSQLAGLVFLVFVVGLALIVAVGVLLFRDRQPALTRDAYEAALAKWAAEGPADYELRLRLTGPRSDTIRVRVRDGAGEFISINGNAIQRMRAKDTWTVASQFGYIRNDLDAVDQGTAEIMLKARFHPKLGYPLSYRRTDLGGKADTGWELLEFATPGSGPP